MIAAGTLIAAPSGGQPAGTLRAGDYVLALEDDTPVARPLRWVGRLEVDLGRHSSPGRAAPVRVQAGAIGPEAPARDLLLSPDHGVFWQGALYQAQSLRNGASIAQDEAAGRVTYVHLEMARHGLLLAEGLPVESYLDTGNRGQFSLGRAGRVLAPDLAAAPSAAALATLKARGCAPLRLDLAAIGPAHAAMLLRTPPLGWALVDEPALAVFADGAAVPLAQFAPGHFRARLPAGTRDVRLASRSFVPNDFDTSVADRRRLGIAVRLVLLGGKPPPPSAFGRGWHLSEPEWRWTDGDARLTLRALPQPTTLDIRTAASAVPGYWVAPARTTV